MADQVQSIIGRATCNFKWRLVQADPHTEYPSMAVVLKRCFWAKVEGNAMANQEGATRRPACRSVARKLLSGTAKP